jgi:acyl carrier protein
MNEAAVYRELTGIFRDLFDDPTIVLRAETSARDIEDWDSARMVSIILAVEEAFQFEVRSREVDELRCIGDFVALILARQARSPARPGPGGRIEGA